MPNNYTSTQLTTGEIKSFLQNKALPFFKQGLVVPLIFATLLYILMRVFFIGSEFDLRESVELYLKTIIVTWAYITLWRLICVGIIWVEIKTTKVKLSKVITLPVLKKTAIVFLISSLTYAVNAKPMSKARKSREVQIEKAIDNNNDVDPKFYFWMK